MKQILKVLAILLVVLILGFILAGLLGPKHVSMKRTVEIKAPKAQIYKILTDYTNFPKWSPWQKFDSAMKQETYGPQGQVGAGYNYASTKVGEGEMKTVSLKENERIDIQLTFLKPFESHPMAAFVLEDGTDGATKVTWSFEQNDVPFASRPFLLLMSMDKMVGGDYERGLANLKDLCEGEDEDGGILQTKLTVKEAEWLGQTYIAMRREVDMNDISATFQECMPRAGQYVADNKMEMAAAPAGLYFTWDTVRHRTDMATAIAVKAVKGSSKEYEVINIPRSKAVMIDYYGSYEKMAEAHSVLKKYIQDKGLQQKPPVIEEYVTDPGTEKDPNKVLTKVYYLVN